MGLVSPIAAVKFLTISAVTDSKTYDGTTTSSVTPTFGSLQSGDTTTTFSQAFDSRNAGSRTLTPSGIVNDGNNGNNYNYTFNTATGTINKAALTISAVTDTKTYDGTTTSTVTPTFGSLQTGDTTTTFSQAFDSRKDIKNPNCEKSKEAEADIHPPASNEPKDRGSN